MTKYPRADKAKELREQGLTQAEIAKELNVSVPTVSRLLNAQDSPMDTSRFPGITWDRYARRYVVRLNGVFVGRYNNINDAVYYRNKTASELWGYSQAARKGYIHDPITLLKVED